MQADTGHELEVKKKEIRALKQTLILIRTAAEQRPPADEDALEAELEKLTEEAEVERYREEVKARIVGEHKLV